MAAGLNRFSTLENVVKTNTNNKSILDTLEHGKLYLKTKFQINCTIDSTITSHNCAFALSDVKDENLKDVNVATVSDDVCSECFELCKCLQNVKDIAKSIDDSDTIYDTNIAIQDIFDYIKHQMRDAQQKKNQK